MGSHNIAQQETCRTSEVNEYIILFHIRKKFWTMETFFFQFDYNQFTPILICIITASSFKEVNSRHIFLGP